MVVEGGTQEVQGVQAGIVGGGADAVVVEGVDHLLGDPEVGPVGGHVVGVAPRWGVGLEEVGLWVEVDPLEMGDPVVAHEVEGVPQQEVGLQEEGVPEGVVGHVDPPEVPGGLLKVGPSEEVGVSEVPKVGGLEEEGGAPAGGPVEGVGPGVALEGEEGGVLAEGVQIPAGGVGDQIVEGVVVVVA